MIYPLLAMLLLVFVMFWAAFLARVDAVRKGQVEASYFRLFEGAPPPQYVTKISNNLNNLFQTPPIFYAAAVIVIILQIETTLILASAWGYVIARYAHSFIHVTSNNPAHRAAAFGASLLCLSVLWIALALVFV